MGCPVDAWAAELLTALTAFLLTASTDFLLAFFGALSESGMKKWGMIQILTDYSELDSPIWHNTSFFYPHFQKVLQKSEWFQQIIFPR